MRKKAGLVIDFIHQNRSVRETSMWLEGRGSKIRGLLMTLTEKQFHFKGGDNHTILKACKNKMFHFN